MDPVTFCQMIGGSADLADLAMLILYKSKYSLTRGTCDNIHKIVRLTVPDAETRLESNACSTREQRGRSTDNRSPPSIYTACR